MNQWLILGFVLSFILGFKYCKEELKNPLLIVFTLFIGYFIYSKYKPTINEKFTNMYEDDSRAVRYGDIITIWSPNVNKFMNADARLGNKMAREPLGRINLSRSLISPEDVSSNMTAVHFMIVDARDPGDIGNTSTIKYGAPVYLRTVQNKDGNFMPTYVAPNKDNNIYMSTQRYDGDATKNEQQLIFESARGLQDSEIYYGDMIMIKSWKKNYIHVSRNDDLVLQDSAAATRNFYVYDRFGQGKNVEWARRGTTRQSSINNNLFSQFAIDGNLLTYSSTAKETNPWWEVTLPKDVLISNIAITNPNTADSGVEKLSKFSIILYDFDNMVVDRKNYSQNKPEPPRYSWNNVNQIARKVRILASGESNLNIAEVKVYGQAVNYSVLLNEEMSKNLISSEEFTNNTSKIFKHRILPKVSDDMTIMFLLELNELPKNMSNIFIKSKDAKINRTPNLLIHPPKNNNKFSNFQYCVTTDNNNNEFGENFMINYNITPNRSFHVAAVHDGGIKPENGWSPCRFLNNNDYKNGIYVCNFMTREFYKISLEDSDVFKSQQVIDLDNPETYGFSFRGLYTDSMSIATIKIYINGTLNTTYKLSGRVKPNLNSLFIGKFGEYSGFNGRMSFLKYSNRVIPDVYIQKESQILTGRLSIELLPGIEKVSTQNIIRLDPNYLPDINSQNPEYTIHFWLNSQRPELGTGNDEPIFEYGIEGLYFRSDKNQIYSKTANGEFGIDNAQYIVKPSQWIHIAYVVDSKSMEIYINGKQVGSKAANSKDVKRNSFSIVKVGGFSGSVGNFSFANYKLSVRDIMVLLNNNPGAEAFDKVRTSFTKNGCTANAVNINDPYDDFNSPWISFATRDENAKLEEAISAFKKASDEGIETEDAIKLKMAEKCYGKVDTQTRVELARNKRLLKAAESNKDKIQCLPKAPFTCKKYNIDDFDIRTHKDFEKYIEKSKIREAPKPIDRVVQLPPDPAKYLTKEFVESNYIDKKNLENTPAFLEMKNKLAAVNAQLKDMENLKDLVTKCQANEKTIASMQKYIEDMKKIGTSSEVSKLKNEFDMIQKDASKDATKLLDAVNARLTLGDMANKKFDIDKDIDDLLKGRDAQFMKDNLELQKIQDRLKEKTGKCAPINRTDRLQPFSKDQKMNGNGTWIKKQMIDLDKIEQMVQRDLKEIEGKLNKMNQKVDKYQATNKLSPVEAAKITNEISSIRKNSNM